jgi:hypothetical protein
MLYTRYHPSIRHETSPMLELRLLLHYSQPKNFVMIQEFEKKLLAGNHARNAIFDSGITVARIWKMYLKHWSSHWYLPSLEMDSWITWCRQQFIVTPHQMCSYDRAVILTTIRDPVHSRRCHVFRWNTSMSDSEHSIYPFCILSCSQAGWLYLMSIQNLAEPHICIVNGYKVRTMLLSRWKSSPAPRARYVYCSFVVIDAREFCNWHHFRTQL